MLYHAENRQFELSRREQDHYSLPPYASFLDVYDGYLMDGAKLAIKQDYSRYLDEIERDGRPLPIPPHIAAKVGEQIGELIRMRDATDDSLRKAEVTLFAEIKNNY